MLIEFFLKCKNAGLPVSTKEFLILLDAMKHRVTGQSVDEFYYLSRMCLIKDETRYDKYDKVFGEYFRGIEALTELNPNIPEDWLRKALEKNLSPEDLAILKALSWDELLETLKQRLEEQKERHEGGSKWIGTGGTSPFGAYGANPAGIRIGQDKSRNRSAVKVWDQRAYKDYDDSVELGIRNIKMALRKLRKFAREGNPEELDMPDTIDSTAKNAGWLDIKMVAERKNAVKVLMLMDVGGTMDDHIKQAEELFSAAKSEFKHIEYYYFHNCIYDFLWKNNRRRHTERFSTWDIIRKYNRDYKLVIVGDATMSPYEILQPGGSVEYNNDEAGAVWVQRFLEHFKSAVWLNPEPQGVWQYRQSIAVIQQIMGNRMHPLTISGLESAIRYLSKKQSSAH